VSAQGRGLRLRLPATSANLGPGFDAVGLALTMHLTIEAHPAAAFAIAPTGRDAALCGALKNNLILDTYTAVLQRSSVPAPPLHLKLHNEIPLGMGCGSSAAAILAGVALASHFGRLDWGTDRIVAEATRIEGHPDNVAACWYGGFTVSAITPNGVEIATLPGHGDWEMLLAMQPIPLATRQARALLPDTYSKADVIFNLQRVGLLTAAFAYGQLHLLKTAMQDRLHQPYRTAACPLLARLLPLADQPWVAGLALSGAGPSVLVFLAEGTSMQDAATRLRAAAGDGVELQAVGIAGGADRTLL